jgi:hypothetical protein
VSHDSLVSKRQPPAKGAAWVPSTPSAAASGTERTERTKPRAAEARGSTGPQGQTMDPTRQPPPSHKASQAAEHPSLFGPPVTSAAATSPAAPSVATVLPASTNSALAPIAWMSHAAVPSQSTPVSGVNPHSAVSPSDGQLLLAGQASAQPRQPVPQSSTHGH